MAGRVVVEGELKQAGIDYYGRHHGQPFAAGACPWQGGEKTATAAPPRRVGRRCIVAVSPASLRALLIRSPYVITSPMIAPVYISILQSCNCSLRLICSSVTTRSLVYSVSINISQRWSTTYNSCLQAVKPPRDLLAPQPELTAAPQTRL